MFGTNIEVNFRSKWDDIDSDMPEPADMLKEGEEVDGSLYD